MRICYHLRIMFCFWQQVEYKLCNEHVQAQAFATLKIKRNDSNYKLKRNCLVVNN